MTQKEIKTFFEVRGYKIKFSKRHTSVEELHKNLRTGEVYRRESAFSTEKKDWKFN